MKQLSPVLLTLVALHAFPKTADADCPKWNSEVSHCATSPSSCVSGAPPLSFTQERLWYSKLYNDTAQQACENAVKYTPGMMPTGVTAFVHANGTQANCVLAGQSHTWTTLYLEEITREPMCERTPNGPYRNEGTFGVDGGSFSSTQRNRVRFINTKVFRDLRSDAGPARPPKIPGEQYDELGMNSTLWVWEDDMLVPYIHAPSAANVDHIIPRKDKFGCDCGPNSYANMLIVSWQLNNKMSNNSQDSDRQAILERWTLP